MAPYIVSSTAEKLAGYIPVLESIIAARISFGTTYYFLHGCLDELEEIALKFFE